MVIPSPNGEIVLVEDDPSDAELEIAALRSLGLTNPTRLVSDGMEALEYFFHTGRYAHSERGGENVCLILLDLRLPTLNGLEVLRRLKGATSTSGIPVIVLSGSDPERDTLEAADFDIVRYLMKPIDSRELEVALRAAGLNGSSSLAGADGEQVIPESKERAVVETASEWIWAIDPEGRLTHSNQAVGRILGYRPEELIGTESLELMHEDDRREVEALLPVLAAERRGWNELTIRWRHKDGTFRYLESNALALVDDSGAVLGWRGTERDITERRQAEEALREQAEIMRAILDNSPAAIWITDREGRYELINQQCERWWGSAGVALGKMDHDCFPTELADEHRANDLRVIETGQAIEAEEHVALDDGLHTYLSFKLPIRAPDGQITGVCGIAADITERRRAEEEVRVLNAELEDRVAKRTAELAAANRELEAFAYSVSHDLRAPLRAIEGFAQILTKEHTEQLDDEGRRLFGVVVKNVRHMGELIESLLEFSQVTRREVQRTVIDMTELAGSVVQEIRGRYPGRPVDVTIQQLGTASGDEPMIRQVLTNLVGNAFKFTGPREHARIEIGRRQEHHEFVFFIRDNGVGFDPRYTDTLFKVFQRLHASSEFEGTGIGLALVQQIVSRHGGRVWAEGAVDEGATFSFSLPDRGGVGDA